MIVELFLLSIISSVSSQSFHHMLTPDDLQHAFSVNNVAEVPDYDIVPISIRKPRSPGMDESFLIQQPFGKGIKMWLKASDGTLFSENLSVSSIKYYPYCKEKMTVDNWKNIFNFSRPFFYENKLYATTLAVNNHTNEKYSVKGFIGDKYIKPVPSHLMDHARRHRRSVNKALDHESDDEIYHIIYDIPQIQKEMLSLPTKSPLASSAAPPESDVAIYPEVFVIVQYGVLNKNDSIQDKVLYVLAFWNGVDMRYRSFTNPKIRLNIARIVFAEDQQVLPHIFNHTDGRYLYDKDGALHMMGNWLYDLNHLFPVNSYDLAVTITCNYFCDNPYNSTNQTCTTTGLAWKNGACSIFDDIRSMKKVAFVRDLGRFNGIKTAAHELGHLFGAANHDYTEEGEKCNFTDGYIMTPWENFATHSFEWSSCSIEQMRSYLRSEYASCLYDKPLYNENPLPRYLPGRLYTADEQCRAFANATLDNTFRNNCHAIACGEPGSYFLIEPAEGTRCGNGKLCLHGLCIDENSIE